MSDATLLIHHTTSQSMRRSYVRLCSWITLIFWHRSGVGMVETQGFKPIFRKNGKFLMFNGLEKGGFVWKHKRCNIEVLIKHWIIAKWWQIFCNGFIYHFSLVVALQMMQVSHSFVMPLGIEQAHYWVWHKTQYFDMLCVIWDTKMTYPLVKNCFGMAWCCLWRHQSCTK